MSAATAPSAADLVQAAVWRLAPNQYDGPCVSCGKKVPARWGYLVTKVDGGRAPICAPDLIDVARRYDIAIPDSLAMRQTPMVRAEAIANAPSVVDPLAALRARIGAEQPKPEQSERPTAEPNFRRGVQPTLDVETTPEVPEGLIRVQAANGQVYTGIAPGTYTMEYPDGHYRTFKVRVQATDAKFAPGRAILEYLYGPDNEGDYRAFAFLGGTHANSLQPWKKFREGHADLLDDAVGFLEHPEKATAARNCIRCNALLTTPESLALGIGPTCIKKGW